MTNRAANTVSVIDVNTLKILATLESKDFPIRVKFAPGGNHVLVSNARSVTSRSSTRLRGKKFGVSRCC